MAVEAQFCSGNYPQDSMTSPGDGLAQILDSLSQKHQLEISHYIIDQYEGLRLNLQEQRKTNLTRIINQIETMSRNMMTQKDQSIARAKNRTAQLELILNKAQTEHQQWQKLVVQMEAQVINLNDTLQQIIHSSSSVYNKNEKDGDDAESGCDVDCLEKDREGGNGMLCKGCGERDACVVLLPCRHLCCCVGCELGFDSCPVCRCSKQNAIRVLML